MNAACLSLLLVLVSTFAAAQERSLPSQQTELERLQQEVRSTSRRIDSLEQLQQSIQRRVLDTDQRISSDQRVIKRLTDQLKALQLQTDRAKGQLSGHQQLLQQARLRYLTTARQLYTSSRSGRAPVVSGPNDELQALRQIRYLTALTVHDSSAVDEVASLLEQSTQSLAQLSRSERDVSRLKKKRESGIVRSQAQREKSEQELQKARRKRVAETDKLMALQRSIEEMQRIVERLEKERTTTPQLPPSGGIPFARLAGQLPMPLRGEITTLFGHSVDPVTKLKAFSPGILISGRPGEPVRAVADGLVAYAGELRGYGTFVIVNHDGQYYTTYAGLAGMVVSKDQRISGGDTIGRSGPDGQLRFELRKGREAIDPVPWLNVSRL